MQPQFDGLDEVLAELTISDMDCRGVTDAPSAASLESAMQTMKEQAVSRSLANGAAQVPDMPAYRAACQGARSFTPPVVWIGTSPAQ